MKLPDLPRPQAPGASAVDMNAVARIEASTKQRLSAANQIGDSLRSEYGAAMEARDRADRTEAKTRSILYKNKLDKLLTEEVERMNSMPLDYPVGDLQEEFTAKQEELRLSELGGVNERVSRYMHDNMLLADSEAGLQATVAVRNQLNARTFHFTTVAHNSVSNEIYDVANDTLYEDQTQVMASEVKANLAGLDAEFRAKYLRDMYDDYTKSYVWGMVKQNRIHEALRFLDKDQRADDRLYDKKGLRTQIQSLGEGRSENAKTEINYLMGEWQRFLSVNNAEGAGEVFPLLANGMRNYIPYTEEQRQWLRVLNKKVKDLQEWSELQADQPNPHALTNAQLEQTSAANEFVKKHGSGVQAEQAEHAKREIDQILAARRDDFPKYAVENHPLVQANYGTFSKAVTQAFTSGNIEDFKQAGAAYKVYASSVRTAAYASGQEPLLPLGAEFEALPEDSPLKQLALDWLKDTTGPQMTVGRIAQLRLVFGNDATGIFKKAKNADQILAIDASDDPLRTVEGLTLDINVSDAEARKAATQYYYGFARPAATEGAEWKQIMAEYTMLVKEAGGLDRTIVDPALMEQAVYSVTGLVDPTGMLNPFNLSPEGVEAYVHNGKMITQGEFKSRFKELFKDPNSDWLEYMEDGYKGAGGAWRNGVGGQFKIPIRSLQGKTYPRSTSVSGVYYIMIKGGGEGGKDGYVLNADGEHLRLDLRKVSMKRLPIVSTKEQLELRDIALGGFEPQP